MSFSVKQHVCPTTKFSVEMEEGGSLPFLDTHGLVPHPTREEGYGKVV